MKRLIIIILKTSLIISCKSIENSNQIYGVYKSEKGRYELILDSNSFSYLHKGGAYVTRSKGSWISSGKSITLKSNLNFKDNMIEVEEMPSEKAYVEVLDSSNKPIASVANIILTYMDNEVSIPFFTDLEGRVTIPTGKEVKSIKIGFIDVFDYEVKNSKNSYIIKIFPDNLDKRYFENESLQINNKYILLDDYKLYKIK